MAAGRPTEAGNRCGCAIAKPQVTPLLVRYCTEDVPCARSVSPPPRIIVCGEVQNTIRTILSAIEPRLPIASTRGVG